MVGEGPSAAVPHMPGGGSPGTRASIGCGRRARWESAMVARLGMLDAIPLGSVGRVRADTSSVGVPVVVAVGGFCYRDE